MLTELFPGLEKIIGEERKNKNLYFLLIFFSLHFFHAAVAMDLEKQKSYCLWKNSFSLIKHVSPNAEINNEKPREQHVSHNMNSKFSLFQEERLPFERWGFSKEKNYLKAQEQFEIVKKLSKFLFIKLGNVLCINTSCLHQIAYKYQHAAKFGLLSAQQGCFLGLSLIDAAVKGLQQTEKMIPLHPINEKFRADIKNDIFEFKKKKSKLFSQMYPSVFK